MNPFILQDNCLGYSITILIFSGEKARLREVQQLAQGYTAKNGKGEG